MKRIAKRDRWGEFIFQVGVWSLVTGLVWVGVSLYQAWAEEPEIKVDKAILAPINVRLDQETLAKLKERKKRQQEAVYQVREAEGETTVKER